MYQQLQNAVPTNPEKAADFALSLLGRDKTGALLKSLDNHSVLQYQYHQSVSAYEVMLLPLYGEDPRITVRFRVVSMNDGATLQSACECTDPSPCEHSKIGFLAYHSEAIIGFRQALEERLLFSRGFSDASVKVLELIRDTVRTEQAAPGSSASRTSDSSVLFYALDQNLQEIHVIRVRRLMSGSLSDKHKVDEEWGPLIIMSLQHQRQGINISPEIERKYSLEDIRILRSFVAAGWDSYRPKLLEKVDPDSILHLLGKTGRFIFGGFDDVISIGEARNLELEWEPEEGDLIKLKMKGSHSDVVLLPTTPRWYFDKRKLEMGPVLNTISQTAAALLERDVGLPIDDLDKFKKTFGNIKGVESVLPALPDIHTLDVGTVQPTPILRLKRSKSTPDKGERLFLAELQFDYLGRRAAADKLRGIVAVDGLNRVKIGRDKDFEREALAQAVAAMGKSVGAPGGRVVADSELLAKNDFIHEVVRFQDEAERFAAKNGWQVEYDDDCQIVVTEPTDMGVCLQETEHGWYNLAMSLSINGADVSMIEILREVLKQPHFKEWLAEEDSSKATWYHELSDGNVLSLPLSRVKGLARIMLELGANDSAPSGLKVSRFDVGFLDDLGSDVKIQGGESLRKLAEVLASPPPVLPDHLSADLSKPLRDYQAMGVQWLQKLKNAGVGAILGDEMGAGKTLQVLCHIWLNVVRNPGATSLIVVPVSLVAKWIGDAAVFLPGMKIGKMLSGEMDMAGEAAEGCHAFITTYAMLTRHENAFAKRVFDIAAFDEAHELRNADAKTTHAAMRLRANQKIAVTGTPLQNKQEEWWAIYTLIVPGLFRDRKWFRSMFVNGMKNDSGLQSERLRLMGKIGSPFRLARTNKEVSNVLPTLETEYHYVDLPEKQREIYESMRAHLNGEVRALINKSGLSRSHIEVLTAINRLRQIAADPRLTKMKNLPGDIPSAKVDYILELSAELISEGKKLFIVSEWTEYLEIIGSRFAKRDLSYTTLHGDLSRQKRSEVIESFRSGKVSALLSTLKVGGVGLDIPEGDVILIVTPWWNPKAIDQVIGRLRRDDRDKTVKAIHVIARGTLEEGVLKIGERKREMIAAVTEGADGVSSVLSVADIEDLLGSV
jgi:superfamily II DNA or RNA helicase